MLGKSGYIRLGLKWSMAYVLLILCQTISQFLCKFLTSHFLLKNLPIFINKKVGQSPAVEGK